jgi:hypothetical protein
MPVIPATWKADKGESQFKASIGKFSKTLFQISWAWTGKSGSSGKSICLASMQPSAAK